MTIDNFRKLALSFPEAEEHDHWGRPSFRVKNKIFATLWPLEKRAVLKFTKEDQFVYCKMDDIFYPVDGGWGRQGYTNVNLPKIKKDLALEVLGVAHGNVVGKSRR